MSYQNSQQDPRRPLYGFRYGSADDDGAQYDSEDGSRWSPEPGDTRVIWRIGDRRIIPLNLRITFDTLAFQFHVHHSRLEHWREQYAHAGDLSKTVGAGGYFRHFVRSERDEDLRVEIRPPESYRPIPFETEHLLAAGYDDSPAYEGPEIYEVAMEFVRESNPGPRAVQEVEYTPPPTFVYSQWGEGKWGSEKWGGGRNVTPRGESVTDGAGDGEREPTTASETTATGEAATGDGEGTVPAADAVTPTRRATDGPPREPSTEPESPRVPPERVDETAGVGGRTPDRRPSATAALTGSGSRDTDRRQAPAGPTNEGGPSARFAGRGPQTRADLLEYIRNGDLRGKGRLKYGDRNIEVGRERPDRRPVPPRQPPRGPPNPDEGGGRSRDTLDLGDVQLMGGDQEADGGTGASLRSDGGAAQLPLAEDEWLFEFPTDELLLDSRDVTPSDEQTNSVSKTKLTLRLDHPELVPLMESPTYLDALERQRIPDGDDVVNDGSGGRNTIVVHAPKWSEIDTDLYTVSEWEIQPFAADRWVADLTLQPVPEYRDLTIMEPGEGFGRSAFGMSPFGE